MSFVELEHGAPLGAPLSKKNVGRVEAGGGRGAAPAQPAGFLARLRERYRHNAWAPLALKAGGILLFMLALAGVGAASILSGVDGVPVPAGAPLGDNIGSAWLASQRPKPAPPAPAASPPASASTDAGAPSRPRGVTPDGKVILNVASAEELTRLPGVGVKRANSIIRLRKRLKRFRRATDLLRIRGIGVRSLKRMLPHLVLDPPKRVDGGRS